MQILSMDRSTKNYSVDITSNYNKVDQKNLCEHIVKLQRIGLRCQVHAIRYRVHNEAESTAMNNL